MNILDKIITQKKVEVAARKMETSIASLEKEYFFNKETLSLKTFLLDPSKTEKDLNWKAKIKLEEGVKRSIEWYDKNPFATTYTHLKIVN